MKNKLLNITLFAAVILFSTVLIMELHANRSTITYQPEDVFLPPSYVELNKKTTIEIPKDCKIQMTFITTPKEFQKVFSSLVKNDTIDQLVITAESIRNDSIRWTVYKTHL